MQNIRSSKPLDPVSNYKHLSASGMDELRIKQVQFEVESWKRLLQFLIEENINMKNRLSEVLRGPFDYSLLDRLDTFQARLVQTDILLSLIRHYVVEVEELLSKYKTVTDWLINLYTKLRILRSSIVTAEGVVIKLESDFNSCLSDCV